MALPMFHTNDIVVSRKIAIQMIRKSKSVMAWVEIGEVTDLVPISKKQALHVVGWFDTGSGDDTPINIMYSTVMEGTVILGRA